MPPLRRRLVPVVALLVLAPWVGEYLLGNLSVRVLPLLPVLVPLYGGGALLVRELARRTGRGWPTILLLATAYGVIEAGLVDQSLFNLTFEALDQTGVTPVPWLGLSAYNAAGFLLGHTIWSVAVPIALAELWAGDLRHRPWLGRWGLTATGALYLLGCWMIFQDLREREGFLARPHQLAAAAATAVVLVALAFLVPKPAPGGPLRWDRGGPRPWLVGVGSFVAASAWILRPENWVGFGAGAVIVVAAAVVVAWLARQPWWGAGHHLALVGGTLLTYAWAGFALTAILEPDDPVRWLGNAAFAATAVVLLVVTAVLLRRRRPTGAPTVPAAV